MKMKPSISTRPFAKCFFENCLIANESAHHLSSFKIIQKIETLILTIDPSSARSIPPKMLLPLPADKQKPKEAFLDV